MFDLVSRNLILKVSPAVLKGFRVFQYFEKRLVARSAQRKVDTFKGRDSIDSSTETQGREGSTQRLPIIG
jgi:hypothetical protein